AVGTTTVTSTATDAHSYGDRCSGKVTGYDTQSPLITCSTSRVVSVLAGTCSSNVTFVVTAPDNCPGVSVVSVPASGSSFAVGTTTDTHSSPTRRSSDLTCTFTVTVNDVQLPVITCSTNRVVSVLAGTCSRNATIVVTATANCAGVNVVSVPASGSSFAVGTTTVTSTATDASGNSATCSF